MLVKPAKTSCTGRIGSTPTFSLCYFCQPNRERLRCFGRFSRVWAAETDGVGGITTTWDPLRGYVSTEQPRIPYTWRIGSPQPDISVTLPPVLQLADLLSYRASTRRVSVWGSGLHAPQESPRRGLTLRFAVTGIPRLHGEFRTGGRTNRCAVGVPPVGPRGARGDADARPAGARPVRGACGQTAEPLPKLRHSCAHFVWGPRVNGTGTPVHLEYLSPNPKTLEILAPLDFGAPSVPGSKSVNT